MAVTHITLQYDSFNHKFMHKVLDFIYQNEEFKFLEYRDLHYIAGTTRALDLTSITFRR